MNHPFVLNNRFLVNPTLNTLTDTVSKKETRLEPRLMNVLCLLAAHVNEMVTREQLIIDVWKNYGGADDGINQAISFLRKVIEDKDKKIIETLPTKGYLLKAIITDKLIKMEKPVKFKNRKSYYWIAAFVVAIGAALFYYWQWNDDDDQLPDLKIQPMPAIKTDVKPNIIFKPKHESPLQDTIKPKDSN